MQWTFTLKATLKRRQYERPALCHTAKQVYCVLVVHNGRDGYGFHHQLFLSGTQRVIDLSGLDSTTRREQLTAMF